MGGSRKSGSGPPRAPKISAGSKNSQCKSVTIPAVLRALTPTTSTSCERLEQEMPSHYDQLSRLCNLLASFPEAGFCRQEPPWQSCAWYHLSAPIRSQGCGGSTWAGPGSCRRWSCPCNHSPSRHRPMAACPPSPRTGPTRTRSGGRSGWPPAD